MESDDGRWIRAQSIQPEGDEGLSEEAGGGENDGWPAPVADRSAGRHRGHGGVPGFSAWAAAAVAVVAAAAGVAIGLFLIRGASLASAIAGAAPGASASASASASARPEQLRVALTGRVLAVSSTSITIGGEGPSVTAAITGTTAVTGRAHGIGGVKAGDEVSAQLTGTADRLTATAIHDLASALPGQLVRARLAGCDAGARRASGRRLAPCRGCRVRVVGALGAGTAGTMKVKARTCDLRGTSITSAPSGGTFWLRCGGVNSMVASFMSL